MTRGDPAHSANSWQQLLVKNMMFGGKHLSRSGTEMRWLGRKWWINDQCRESFKNEGDYAGTVLYEYVSFPISPCIWLPPQQFLWVSVKTVARKCFLSSASEKLLPLPVLKALALSLGDKSGSHSTRQATAGDARVSLKVPSLPSGQDEGCVGPADCPVWVGGLRGSESTGRCIQAGVLVGTEYQKLEMPDTDTKPKGMWGGSLVGTSQAWLHCAWRADHEEEHPDRHEH